MTIYLDGPGEREPLTSGALGLEQMVGSEVGVFSAGWMLPGKGFKPSFAADSCSKVIQKSLRGSGSAG
eukprot:scaffold120786_cov14-Tisochrysis_lutea.AAC.1